MSKDPAFLFYSSDFLTGVSDLTMEERGQYITLLCLQHQKGRLSGKAMAIAVPDATADVLAKFRQDPDGCYYNARLEEEAEKRAAHSEKQRQRAINGWKKRKQQSQGEATANAMALPLENEIENEIENVDIDENKNLSKKISQIKSVSVDDEDIVEGVRFQKPGRMSTDEHKFHSHTLELAKVFNLNEFMHMKHLVEINKWIETVDVDYVRQQIRSYLEYKVLTGENRCGWISWIEGKWNEEDFTEKLKQFKNGRGKKSASQVIADQLRDDPEYRAL
jgi:hypothetical protein